MRNYKSKGFTGKKHSTYARKLISEGNKRAHERKRESKFLKSLSDEPMISVLKRMADK